MAGKYKIVMVRHGESEWNQKNLFCGWYDASLSDKGKVKERTYLLQMIAYVGYYVMTMFSVVSIGYQCALNFLTFVGRAIYSILTNINALKSMIRRS